MFCLTFSFDLSILDINVRTSAIVEGPCVKIPEEVSNHSLDLQDVN